MSFQARNSPFVANYSPFGRNAFAQGGSVFNPVAYIQSLFAGSAPGCYFDVSDLSTMFQDAAGTTPAAVNSPVGLLLDKSQGLVLGSERVTTPYTGSVSGAWSISATLITRNGSSTGLANPNFGGATLDTTKLYQVSFTVSNKSGDDFLMRLATGTAYRITANGVHTCRIPPGSTATQLVFAPWAGTVGEATISNISVRELPGNHATQATGAARPLLKSDGTHYWLEGDGVDDWLRATFTITQPWDRISAIRQISWTSLDQIFGGSTLSRVFQSSSSPTIGMYDGTGTLSASSLAIGSDGVLSEHHNGGSSRLSVDNGAPATGVTGTEAPAGVTLFANISGTQQANARLYHLVMRQGTFTDPEIATLRSIAAAKAGITL